MSVQLEWHSWQNITQSYNIRLTLEFAVVNYIRQTMCAMTLQKCFERYDECDDEP